MFGKIREDVLQWWYLKNEQERKKTSKNLLLVGSLGALISYNVWMNSADQDADPELNNESPVEQMPLTSTESADVLARDISEATTSGIDSIKEELDSDIDARIAQKVQELLGSNDVGERNFETNLEEPVAPDFPSGVTLPPPVPSSDVDFNYVDITESEPQAAPQKWSWGGGRVVTGGATKSDYKPQNNQATVSDVREIDLPVGFMKATLLVGINARSGEFGQSNPQQIVFNVSAPAQLPNRIKLNLKGCFVVANASGDLSAKRIEALPVSMNCLTQDGEYKITSSSLKGFVQDADGKRGLDARVVSRARHLLASTLFAKTVTGFGKVISAQGVTSTNTAFGNVTTTDNSDIAKNAAAAGLAEGFDDLGDYLLELAKQIQPTLEHGAGKSVLIWIAEASTLKIEEVKK